MQNLIVAFGVVFAPYPVLILGLVVAFFIRSQQRRTAPKPVKQVDEVVKQVKQQPKTTQSAPINYWALISLVVTGIGFAALCAAAFSGVPLETLKWYGLPLVVTGFPAYISTK
ncbi:MAG: hypothetical protein OXR68_02635 [Alphaproteobacteria bacterium]|nr:hypothetical protein [Alphaproteobacteria bacterium]MDD9919501.1 hypothetical protein [Alphaproteobacteria bacterium]